MAKIQRNVIERLLHEGPRGLRLIQELPILPDVWAAFGEDASATIDLLLSPSEKATPPQAAKALVKALGQFSSSTPGDHKITPLQGLVTATLSFPELAFVVAPMLGMTFRSTSRIQAAKDLRVLEEGSAGDAARERAASLENRTGTLIALIEASRDMDGSLGTFSEAAAALEKAAEREPKDAGANGPAIEPYDPPLLRRATLNRPVMRLGSESVRTVKADAARTVFAPKCDGLVWAVIDSGIDATHDAFTWTEAPEGETNKTRVWRTYDFTRLRELTSLDVLMSPNSKAFSELHAKVETWLADAPKFPEDDGLTLTAKIILKQLAADADLDRPPSWALIEPALRQPHTASPPADHGTHVAGILAGNWKEKDLVGVCPDMKLLDIRILGASNEETESAIIGALEFIKWLNSRNRWRLVHGVNLSVGLKHDVRNWACGQTPVCVACDEVVASGVVVVAAAGNDGWQSFLVGDDKRYDGYAAGSIMDPGNTESVITVGSTHRDRPHQYGVSFFSSRGPTGDGRMKPDLLAPGEKIDGPLPNNSMGSLDGTSMAAPHVSGVAALLMARHNELQGKPDEIKKILMARAVSLGREQSAQGAGLVDALAALQGT